MSTTPQGTPKSPGRYWLDIALDTADPHSMTGAAVTGLLAILVEREEAEGRQAQENYQVSELLNEIEEAVAGRDLRQQVIDDILEKIRKSTAKLSNEIRDIVDEAFKVESPATVEPTPPADDAPVDEWRAYARSRGDVEVTGVDTANRSQIRTMLGLSHGSAG